MTARRLDAIVLAAALCCIPVAATAQQAAIAEHLSVTPAFKGADSAISAEARKWKADLSNPNSVLLNDEWWGGKFAEVNKRFKEWILT